MTASPPVGGGASTKRPARTRARASAVVLGLLLSLVAAADPLEGVLAELEDLRFEQAHARLAPLLQARPDDVGVRRVEVLLAAWDPSVDLRALVRSHRLTLKAAPSAALAHAVLLARSLALGYPTPWVAQPRLQTLGDAEVGDVRDAARQASERAGATAWELLLAARLARDGARRVGLLRRALSLAPDRLEVLAAVMAVNLDGQREVLRDRLERLAERGGPRAGGCLLLAAEGMVSRAGRWRRLLEKVRTYGETRYGDDAALRLLAGTAAPLSERIPELERLRARGVTSAFADVSVALVDARLRAGQLEQALAVARELESRAADVFGSRAVVVADRLQASGHHRPAYEWFKRGMGGDPRNLDGGQLERFAMTARALGEFEEAARAYELAAERGGVEGVQASIAGLVARALASPLVFVGAGLVLLVSYLAVPLALLVLAGRGRRALVGWPVAIGVVAGALLLELLLPAGERRVGLWSGLATALGMAVVVQAGLGLSRSTGMVPGREVRALRKRLAGKPVPWLRYWVRLVLCVAAMFGVTVGLVAWFRPEVSPLAASAARVAPDADAARLLDAAREPLGAIAIAVRAALREEVLCRLFFLPLLVRVWRDRRWGRWAAVTAIAALWALGHVGVAVPEVFKLLQVFSVGVMLGWLALRQGVLSAFLAHAAFNVASVAWQAWA